MSKQVYVRLKDDQSKTFEEVKKALERKLGIQLSDADVFRYLLTQYCERCKEK